jgi:hypothetical protein
MKWLFGMAGMACLLALSPAAHAQEIRTVPVRFAPGATGAVLQGAIAGRKSVSYTVGAEAGQTLKVRLKSSSPSISFNLYGPGRGPGEEALAIGDLLPETNRFEGKLDISGVYTVNVFLIRAAARRNARSNYTLEISIPGNTAAVPQEPVRNDFADGLQGGPDNWAVAGVPAGDVLQLRRGPSAKEASVASLANGAVLRNGGCRMVGGQRWCKVETTGAVSASGWVAGRYLVESAAQAPSTDLAAACRQFAAIDFATQPARIRTAGTRRGPEGSLVDATADLGRQGVKPFACRFDAPGRYLGIFSKVDEGKL